MSIVNIHTGHWLPSPHQNELLTHLSQEAAEVIQEACKAQCYGFDSRNPHAPGMTNKERLEHELADFVATVRMIAKTGVIDLDKVERLVAEKIIKKQQWLLQPADPT